jgi:nucleotide-binding universal stress UspA family protein
MVVTGPRRPLGTVLIATDFSAYAEFASGRAALLPLRPGASIDLLHVLPDESDASAAERMRAEAKRLLEVERQRVTRTLEAHGNRDRDALCSVAQGKPFVEIVRNARHGRAELIVVGRHGKRSFPDMLIGSTAERVVRKGDVSVLVVARAPRWAYRRPLVAVDMSDSSRRALELALRICDPAVEKIDAVHVISPPSPLGVAEGADMEGFRLEEEARARTEVSEFLGTIEADVQWNVIIKTGDARRGILDEAARANSDLIALGTKGRTGLAHVLVGSVAEGVLRAATCDVLVARLPRVDFSLP